MEEVFPDNQMNDFFISHEWFKKLELKIKYKIRNYLKPDYL